MPAKWTVIPVPAIGPVSPFRPDLMILLTDGSLLLHNGFVSSVGEASHWARLTPDAHGRYETGTWSGPFDMGIARQWFASGVTRSGHVFVIGGEHSNDPISPNDTPTGEIFDPTTNTWSPLVKPAAFDFIRGDCNGTVLPDGKVLLGAPDPNPDPPNLWPNRTAVWDPETNAWMEAGKKFGTLAVTTKTDSFEEETFALLPNGEVLVPAVRDMPGAQLYKPERDEYVAVAPCPVNLAIQTLSGAEVFETAPTIVLPDGHAFSIGGTGQTALFSTNHHPTGTWKVGPTFPADISGLGNWPTLTALDAPAALMPNGRVILLAGSTAPDFGDFFSLNPQFLEFDPHSHASALPFLNPQPPSPPFPSGNFTWQCVFQVLPSGELLCSTQTNNLFLYTPDPAAGAPHHDWRPANLHVHQHMHPGESYRIEGTQLNGLSQAAVYGDDAGMSTNYPIVRLHNTVTGQIVYLRSHTFSTLGITVGHNHRQHCTIDIPATIPHGHYRLHVIANGIASEHVEVEIH